LKRWGWELQLLFIPSQTSVAAGLTAALASSFTPIKVLNVSLFKLEMVPKNWTGGLGAY
jgi:hypothetical protein